MAPPSIWMLTCRPNLKCPSAEAVIGIGFGKIKNGGNDSSNSTFGPPPPPLPPSLPPSPLPPFLSRNGCSSMKNASPVLQMLWSSARNSFWV